ncbi:unnamed protein product [Urochloa humidicola]
MVQFNDDEKPPTVNAGRAGLDLVVCVDIGTWEQGQERILKMKKALELVVLKLTPKDRLSIVTRRNDKVDRLCPLRCMTTAAQADLKALISGLTNCAINIQKSYEMALSTIHGRVHTGSRTACIFYVTDDYERAGDAGSVNPGNVPVHTFGFGKRAGHGLLKNMANKSPGGTYSSVPVGSDLSVAFAQLLDGLVKDDVKQAAVAKPLDEWSF